MPGSSLQMNSEVSSVVFGRMLSASEVEADIIGALERWLPTYVAEAERQEGLSRGAIEPIRSVTTEATLQRFPEDQLPCLIVVSPGLASRPEMAGEKGSYRARWAIGISVVVEARTRAETDRLAKIWAALVAGLMLQQPDMGKGCRGVTWEDQRYDEVPAGERRTLAAGQNEFTVEYDGAIFSRLGPSEPDTDPVSWPLVQTVNNEYVMEDK